MPVHIRLEVALFQITADLGTVHYVAFAHALLLRVVDVRRIEHDIVNAQCRQFIVRSEAAESCLIGRMVRALRVIAAQMLIQSCCRGRHRKWFRTKARCTYTNVPLIQMNVDSNVHIFSFERNFVTLHRRKYFV